MMIIEGIARLRSSEIVFYTPQYFADVGDFLNMIGRGRTEYVQTKDSSPVRDVTYFRRPYIQDINGIRPDGDYEAWKVDRNVHRVVERRADGSSVIRLYFPDRFIESNDRITDATVKRGYRYFEACESGRILLYGQRPVEYTHVATVVDASYVVNNLNKITVTRSDDKREFYLSPKTGEDSEYTDTVIKPGWVINDPPIPPEYGLVSDTEKMDIYQIRSRYLSEKYAHSPKYVSFERNGDVLASVAAKNDLIIGENRGIDGLLFNSNTSLFFVNGLCCRPYIPGRQYLGMNVEVGLENAVTYLRNQKDRDRGLVIMDLYPIDPNIQVKYVPFSKLTLRQIGRQTAAHTKHNLTFTLPVIEDFEPSKVSVLLVLDGRLFFPEEFIFAPRLIEETDAETGTTSSSIHGEITIDERLYTDVYEFDKRVCQNDFFSEFTSTEYGGSGAVVKSERVNLNQLPIHISEEARDLDPPDGYNYRNPMTRMIVLDRNYNYDWKHSAGANATYKPKNSFVILINKPGLQILKNHQHSTRDEQQFMTRENQFSQNQIMFSGTADGLLFDKATRSVVDYVKRSNDMTFYTPNRTKALSWSSRLVFVTNCTNIDVPVDYKHIFKCGDGLHGHKDARMLDDVSPNWTANSMITPRYAVMHDDVRLKQPLRTIKPDYCMLDFVFKG